MKSKIVFGITGANGFVGSAIASYLRKKGYEVYELGRRPSAHAKDYFIPFSLENGASDAGKLKKIGILVHCAYNMNLTRWKDIKKINIDGTINFLDQAACSGVKKIIVISSLSAFEGCKSKYGKAKMAIEKKSKEIGAFIIRPGLVYGKGAKSMVGTLSRLVSISRLIPLIGSGNQKLYLCHSEDLARLVHAIAFAKRKPGGIIIAASEKGMSFREMLGVLAGRKLVFVPIPYFMVFSMLKALDILNIKIGLRSDSLVGLMNLNPHVDFSETRKYDAKFREFSAEAAKN